jgi:hypothetical protein
MFILSNFYFQTLSIKLCPLQILRYGTFFFPLLPTICSQLTQVANLDEKNLVVFYIVHHKNNASECINTWSGQD